MLGIRKCPKCGIDVADTSAVTCPMCSAPLFSIAPRSIGWLGPLIQVVFMITFMLLFHFPKRMILYSGAFILVATALSTLLRRRQGQLQPTQPLQLSRPGLYRVLSVFIALAAIALFAILLFSTVIFLNDWSRYQTYKAQPYHRADFVVMRTYFQRGSKGAIDAYASGTVEGQKEWMSLTSYLPSRPRNAGEVEEMVPAGTSIPIYLFPNLKGRLRFEFYKATPPADSYYQEAMAILSKAPLAFVIVGGVLFLLLGLRKTCVREEASIPSLPNPQFQ